MKITFINNYFYPVTGGAENVIYFSSQELIKRGHEIEVFTSNLDRTKKIKVKQENIDGVTVKRFNALFRFSLGTMLFPGIFKAVQKSNADIFHVYGYRMPYNLVTFLTKKKCIITPLWPEYPKESRNFIASLLVILIDFTIGKLMLNKFDGVIALTNLEKTWLENKLNIKKDKIKTISIGIPKDYLKVRDKNTFRKKLHISKDKILVFSLSRIHKSKGLEQIINVANFFPEVIFVIAGKDEGHKAFLESLIINKNLKNIKLIGSLSEEEKLQAMSSADIFLHASHFEAFGIVIFEAFSQRTAVLVSNSGALPYVVGNCGLVFEDKNIQDLKDKLNNLIKNKKLRNAFAIRGNKKVKNFTWDKITNKLENLYKGFIEKHGQS